MSRIGHINHMSIHIHNIYVALHGTPDTLGVPLPWCSCLSMAVLGNFGVGTLQTQCV